MIWFQTYESSVVLFFFDTQDPCFHSSQTHNLLCALEQHFRELANCHWCVGCLVLVCFGAGEGQLLWHLPGLCGWLTRNVTTCSIPLLVQVICSKSKPQQPKE